MQEGSVVEAWRFGRRCPSAGLWKAGRSKRGRRKAVWKASRTEILGGNPSGPCRAVHRRGARW